MLENIMNGENSAVIADILMRTGIVLVAWLMIFAACLVDFWSGCSTARALGQKLNSHGFRKTLDKIGDYFKVGLVFLLFDILGSLFAWYDLPYASVIVAVCCIVIEGASVFENSKRKKSNAAKITEIAKEIVEAVSEKDAKKLIKVISAEVSAIDKNTKWAKEETTDGDS